MVHKEFLFMPPCSTFVVLERKCSPFFKVWTILWSRHICRVWAKENGRGTGIRFSSASSSMYHVLKSNHERHENELVARHPFRFSEFFRIKLNNCNFQLCISYHVLCVLCTLCWSKTTKRVGNIAEKTSRQTGSLGRLLHDATWWRGGGPWCLFVGKRREGPSLGSWHIMLVGRHQRSWIMGGPIWNLQHFALNQ